MEIITKESVSKLYLATFGRPIDSEGLEYWTNTGRFSNNSGTNLTSMEDISESFSNQTEYSLKYPLEITDENFIISIYENLFQRDPDIEGLNYWLNELSEDNITRDKAILAIINGVLDNEYGNDKSLISNRAEVALYLAQQGSFTAELAKQNDIIQAIMDVTDDDATIIKQEAIAESIINPPNSHSFVNSGIGTVSNYNTHGVSEVDSTIHWSSNQQEITYSFNHNIPSSYYPYENLTTNWSELNQSQKDTVGLITQEINQLLDIQFKEVSDDGLVRFNVVDMQPNTAGFSFYPSQNPDYGGDVFLSQSFNTDPANYGLNKGETGWLTITHELGHALGLKHPFNDGNTQPPYLPITEDDFNHTIMSYTPNDDVVPQFLVSGLTIRFEYHILYPQLYSLYDISALQAIYGANTTTHIEDDTYSTQYSDYKIQTIWDAGGKDTIDLSLTKGSTTIDLHGGTLNSIDVYSLNDIISLHQEGITQPEFRDWISTKITEIYNTGNLYTGKNNFAIANGVIIEDIITGSGDDIITDNEVDNHISTGNGDDHIYIGNGGSDYVDGGEGNDSLYIRLSINQITTTQLNNNDYVITADNFEVVITDIEEIHLTNGIYTPDLLIV